MCFWDLVVISYLLDTKRKLNEPLKKKKKEQFKRWGEMPEVSVLGILSYPQPTSRAQWEVFLAGAALKTLCPGLDFSEKYSTCPCQSLAPSSHSYCQKVVLCSTQRLDFNLQTTDSFKLKQGGFRLDKRKKFLRWEWWISWISFQRDVVVTVPRSIKNMCRCVAKGHGLVLD